MAPYFNREKERKDPLASPLLAKDLTGLPPACLVLAGCDPLLDQGLMYAARLKTPASLWNVIVMEGMLHGFFNWTYGKSFEALGLGARFLNQRL